MAVEYRELKHVWVPSYSTESAAFLEAYEHNLKFNKHINGIKSGTLLRAYDLILRSVVYIAVEDEVLHNILDKDVLLKDMFGTEFCSNPCFTSRKQIIDLAVGKLLEFEVITYKDVNPVYQLQKGYGKK